MNYRNLDNGINFANKQNHYKALECYKIAIDYEKSVLNGLNNSATSYDEIGLKKEAFNRINLCITEYENGKWERNLSPEFFYLNRAKLYNSIHKDDLMLSDINKSLKLNPKYSEAHFFLGLYKLINNNQIEAEQSFSESIKYSTKPNYYHLKRADAFLFINDFDMALNSYLEIDKNLYRSELIDDIIIERIVDYKIGKCYYYLNNLKEAKNYYEKYKILDGKENYYDVKKFETGLVSSLDIQSKIGYVICKTTFCYFENIMFEFKNCKIVPNLNDRVKFTINFDRLKKYNLSEVEPNNEYEIPQSSKQIIGIISNYSKFKNISENCGFSNVSNDFKFCYVFYPKPYLISYNYLKLKMANEILYEAEKKGYAFFEISIVLNKNKFDYNLLEFPNFKKSLSINHKKTFSNIKKSDVNGWTCNVCDGNEETGCLMSDIENCTNGKGI